MNSEKNKAEEVIKGLKSIKVDERNKEYIDYAIRSIQCVESVKEWIDERTVK